MTSRVGLIEWLENTAVLKDVLTEAMTKKEESAYFDNNRG